MASEGPTAENHQESEESTVGACRCTGVGEETVVTCGFNSRSYGPAGDSEFVACPYCGADAKSGDHRIDPEVDEVFCGRTTQSTYRYCPGCGGALD